jgi:hypothetical protein
MLVGVVSTPDKNFLSFSGPVGLQYTGDLTPPDDSYSDTLKFSAAHEGDVYAGIVIGGREDCVDINNLSRDLFIHSERWEPRGKYLATIKGGSRDIHLGGKVRGHGSEVDIDLGNHSDQSQRTTGRVTLDLRTEDGSPLTVRVINAITPIFVNSHEQRYVVVAKVPGFFRRAFAWAYAKLKHLFPALCLAFAAVMLPSCRLVPKPQMGGTQSASLGGGDAPTTVTVGAPENPKTPTETMVKKTIVRDYYPTSTPLASTTGGGAAVSAVSENFLEPSAAASSSSVPTRDTPRMATLAARSSGSGSTLSREVITEEATTRLGASQADTARELGVRLTNMRGVMYVGLVLLFAGPIIGWKLGWMLNGCIAGAVGLGLVILATVVPGNEAWLGLCGLLLIPLVGYVYYKSRADASESPRQLTKAEVRSKK